jgi:hypothetical protein
MLGMKLEPQDIVVLLKIAKYAEGRPPYSQIAAELFLSTSRVHASVRRAKAARLLHGSELGERPNYAALEEFLIHGVKYAFPAQRGEMSRGLPTAFAAAPLNEWITPSDEPPPVWPYSEGNTRGYALYPLHKNVPKAAIADPYLYEMLALVDALREGRTRERGLAEKEISKRLNKLRL